MKRIFLFLSIFVVVSLACDLSINIAPTNEVPTAASTPVLIDPPTPTPEVFISLTQAIPATEIPSAALSLIHQSPERRWKVNDLAKEVALSRSAFSARFTGLVGEPPMTYLTRWRMLKASRLLKNDVGMETIADLLGYKSEAAFRKAFKREVGLPPAQYRKLGQSQR